MREFDRPVSSAELYAIWGGDKPLQVFEYHLATLATLGVAELVVTKSEILFRLVRESSELKQEAFEGEMSSVLAELEAQPGRAWPGQGIHQSR
jgi:hypothetical protein